MECTAVIPCHNEAHAIGPLVQSTLRHLPHVIVVDDGSTDDTAERARAAGAEVIRIPINGGKGAALQHGLQRARELGVRWVLLLDGDGQHMPDDIPAFLQVAEADGAELVVGNRMSAPVGMPVIRRITNRVMSAMLSWLTGTPLADTQCGFRLLRLDRCAALPPDCARFEVESEILLASLVTGQRVAFVPIQCRYTSAPSHIHRVRDTWRWLCWLGRSRPRFTALRARNARRNPLATDTLSKSIFPPTKEHSTASIHPRSSIRRITGGIVRIAGFLCLGYLMGVAMDWSAGRSRPDRRADFWWGLAHGALMPASLPTLAVGRDVTIYAPHNTGVPYKLGYTMGVNGAGLLFFGLAFWKPKTRGQESPQSSSARGGF